MSHVEISAPDSLSRAEREDLAREREIERAARNFLDVICEMTSEQFARGEDREARLRLARALGLSEAAYGL